MVSSLVAFPREFQECVEIVPARNAMSSTRVAVVEIPPVLALLGVRLPNLAAVCRLPRAMRMIRDWEGAGHRRHPPWRPKDP